MTRTTHTAAPVPRWALGIATALAIVVAMVYLAIGLGMVAEDFKSPPAPVMLLAGLGYLVGGGLILLADRRLLLAGAVVNVLILLLFVLSALLGNATLDLLSLSGKAAQVVLGVLLLWFVRQLGTGWKVPRV